MPHLLLVDDDEEILVLMTDFFRKHGHLVSTAHDAEEMFAAIKTKTIDLVILGADDYLTKPFDQRELLARVKSVLRRTAELATAVERSDMRPVIRFAGWRLDVARRELRSTDDKLHNLSAHEFDLLLAFAEHPQRVLTRDHLIDLARGSSHLAYDRSIDGLVSRIRRKLEEDPKSPTVIRTVRNGGYIFSAAVTRG